ncbi:MAG: hypothetical protein IKN65_04970 [Clostridia bacterium]|nr:hypothetical protein [Clostridia bacterium]
MELVKDIYFNTDKLVENTNVKVSYTGKFYQGENEKVFLHYGYGKDWNNVNEIEMKKTDLGYQAELNLAGSDSLNFCFKNQNNEWDNNFGKNYSFNIEKPEIHQNQEQKTLVFWGKNFGQDLNQSDGVLKDVVASVPTSVDTFINKNGNDTIETIQCTEIPCTSDENVECITATEIVNPVNNQQEQSIALAPTGFIYWTQKIRETVCKFFSYVPKLISGNYKRNLNKNNEK